MRHVVGQCGVYAVLNEEALRALVHHARDIVVRLERKDRMSNSELSKFEYWVIDGCLADWLVA